MNKFFPAFILLLSSLALAQTFTISGTVRDEEGNYLPGVNVIVAGLNTGDATGLKGDYLIKNIPAGIYNLQFSAVGFRSQKKEIILKQNQTVNVVLQTEAITTDQVIVSAGKHEQLLSELPVSASLMSNEEINSRNYSNLRDALKYVPGVNLIDDQLSIRGSSGYSRGAGARVLVALDGLPFYTGDTGEIIWESVPVHEIERVEIIKGASSSLYGSTAIGGVINIITRKSDQPLTYIKSYIGSYDRPEHDSWDWSGGYRLFNGLTLSHSNKFGDLNFTASLTRLEDEGFRRNNFNKRFIGYLKTGYRFSENSNLIFIFNSLNQHSGNFIYWKNSRHALEPPDEDLQQTVRSNRYLAGLISENKLSDKLNLIIRGSFYNTEWTDKTASFNTSEARQLRGEVQTNWQLNKNILVVSGAEIIKSHVTSNIFGGPESFGAGGYLQGEAAFTFPLKLTAGFRYDYDNVKNYSASDAFSPKMGFNYKLNENISFRGMIGTGFRAPSLAEKFTSTFVSGIGIKANPDIIPEKNVTAETGMLLQNKILTADIAVFRNEYYDMIEPTIDPSDGQIVFTNLVRARIQGFEINISPSVSDYFLLNMNYTYMYPRDINNNKTLKYRPRHLFYSSLSFSKSGFEAGINFRFWSRVEEMDFELVTLGIVPDGEKRVPVYVADLNAGYNFIYTGFPGRVYINLKNLLNYNYVELIGNIAPIRNIALSFEFFL